QAEDGVRSATVTGVQTCALPIYRLRRCGFCSGIAKAVRSTPSKIPDPIRICLLGRTLAALSRRSSSEDQTSNHRKIRHKARDERSEERRVWKESRNPLQPQHDKK